MVIFDLYENNDLNKKYKFVKGDILNVIDVNKVTRNAKYVFNFSGEADIEKANLNPINSIKANVLGCANILNSCVKNKVDRYIHASSIYVNSEQGGVYRSTKQAAELITENYNDLFKQDFTIIRFGSLYGPRANKFNFINNALMEAIKHKKIIRDGDGEEVRQYIHVIDAAKLCLEVIKPKYKNQYINITGNETLKVKDLLLLIKEIFGNKIKIIFNKKRKIEGHYKRTPYMYKPRSAINLNPIQQTDLGQGIYDLIHELQKKINN